MWCRSEFAALYVNYYCVGARKELKMVKNLSPRFNVTQKHGKEEKAENDEERKRVSKVLWMNFTLLIHVLFFCCSSGLGTCYYCWWLCHSKSFWCVRTRAMNAENSIKITWNFTDITKNLRQNEQIYQKKDKQIDLCNFNLRFATFFWHLLCVRAWECLSDCM